MFQLWTSSCIISIRLTVFGKFLSHSACNPLVTSHFPHSHLDHVWFKKILNHSYYSHCVHVWFKKMYELMTILNMSQSPFKRLGFLQNIGRLAVVIWETFLTKNRHVECKHRKPTPSYTPYVRIGFRMFDKILAGKDSMHRTYPKKVNIFQTKQSIKYIYNIHV